MTHEQFLKSLDRIQAEIDKARKRMPAAYTPQATLMGEFSVADALQGILLQAYATAYEAMDGMGFDADYLPGEDDINKAFEYAIADWKADNGQFGVGA